MRLVEERTSQLQQANDHLQRLSYIDALTGIANRRHFEEILELEWRRAFRARSPMTLLMLDIDRFKLYNDTFGHRAGDECLARVATVLDDSVQRAGDLMARYGGEEFAAILAGTDESGGAEVAERLRAAVERLGIKRSDDPAQVVTISIGVAAGIPGQVSSHEVLLSAADKALYEAKRAGRNRVGTASGHVRHVSRSPIESAGAPQRGAVSDFASPPYNAHYHVTTESPSAGRLQQRVGSMNGRSDQRPARPETVVDWRPPPPRRPRRRGGRLLVLAVLAAIVLGGGTALSYYVEALWFDSLGYSAVFWKTLNVQAAIFVGFALVTFAVLYGAFLALKPARLGEIAGGTIIINGQPLKLPVEPVLKLIALARLGRHRVHHRPGHDGPMADAGALLVCAGRRGAGARSDFQPPAHLLPVHAARLGDHHRLADDARRRRLRDGRAVRRRHRRDPRPGARPDAGAQQ